MHHYYKTSNRTQWLLSPADIKTLLSRRRAPWEPGLPSGCLMEACQLRMDLDRAEVEHLVPHTKLEDIFRLPEFSSSSSSRDVGVCPGGRKVARLTFRAVCGVRNGFTGLVPSGTGSGRSLADGFLWPIGTPSSGSALLTMPILSGLPMETVSAAGR